MLLVYVIVYLVCQLDQQIYSYDSVIPSRTGMCVYMDQQVNGHDLTLLKVPWLKYNPFGKEGNTTKFNVQNYT